MDSSSWIRIHFQSHSNSIFLCSKVSLNYELWTRELIRLLVNFKVGMTLNAHSCRSQTFQSFGFINIFKFGFKAYLLLCQSRSNLAASLNGKFSKFIGLADLVLSTCICNGQYLFWVLSWLKLWDQIWREILWFKSQVLVMGLLKPSSRFRKESERLVLKQTTTYP